VTLKVLNTFELRVRGQVVRLAPCGAKVLAFLAIRGDPIPRTKIASELWPEKTTERAVANLRSALWRLRPPAHEALDISPSYVGLPAGVVVDFQQATAAAHRLLDHGMQPTEADLAVACVSLQGDLLPDWDDEEWLRTEREHFGQLRLHALESLSGHLVAAGQYWAAAGAALAAIHADPLRESARRALIRVHLAEGNYAEAFRQYNFYRRSLLTDLGIQDDVTVGPTLSVT